MFFDALDGGFVTAAFAHEKSAAVRALYRAAFPVIHQVMKKSMGITAENAAAARERVQRALDFVARESEATGYLVGDAFSVADLACASLLMLTIDASEFGGPVPPPGEKVERWRARWADHPGTRWVRDVFRKHHPR